MPNHINNRISSKDKSVYGMITGVFANPDGDESLLVDFNKLIPQPEVLRGGDNVSASVEALALLIFNGVPDDDPSVDDAWSLVGSMKYNSGIRTLKDGIKGWSDSDVKLLFIYLNSLHCCGHSSWYSWNIENWGTKWNAYNVRVDDNVEFHTAWSCPEPVVRKLAEVVSFDWEWLYASEDIGYDCGIWRCVGGELSHVDMDGDIRFACDVFGYDYDEYVMELEE